MKQFLAAFGALICVGLVCVLAVALLWVGTSNAEISARNAFIAKQAANESSYDKMWKILKQQGGIPEAERESFKATYVEIMNATKGVAGNGQLASFFQQAKIDVTPDLFAKFMTTIEAQRESFHRDQEHLLKLKEQHDNIRLQFPGSLIVGSRPPLEARLVTSSKTKEAFESGEDNAL